MEKNKKIVLKNVKRYLSTGAQKCIDEYDNKSKNIKLKKDLFAKVDEIPAVFSQCKDIDFKEKVTVKELKAFIRNWVESIKNWVIANEYFIGHIKIFTDLGEGNNLWISTTGDSINVKEYICDENYKVNCCSVNVTAIIFGSDEEALNKVILDDLNKQLSTLNKE